MSTAISVNPIPAPQTAQTRDSEWKGFLNWALVWIGLTNISFMALWIVGAPPRYGEIMVIALIGLLIKNASFLVRYCYFFAVMVWTTLNFVADIFNLDIQRLLSSIKFVFSIQLATSAEYIAVAIGVVAILVIGFFLLRRDSGFSRWSLSLAGLGLAFGVAAIDYQIAGEMRGHYKRAAPAGAPFSSAMEQSGMPARADGQRHLVLIMVESLGQPVDNAEMDKLLFAHYKKSDAIAARYELSSGTSPFFGSTTAGEIREMCSRWGDYFPLMEAPDSSCLPNRLKAKGYDTVAMHSFNGIFFDRHQWYPNIGFQQPEFAEDLIANGASACGGVFPGACDRDIPQQIAAKLKVAEKPTFLYWLTVNSHLPVLEGHNLNVENCGRISSELATNYPHICTQFAVWDDVDQAVIQQITASDFPDADILLVGDHMPPFFDRHHRRQIDPGQVPWLYLKRK